MNSEFLQLPLPGTPALADLIPSTQHRAIYEHLYDRHNDLPTMVEIMEHAAAVAGEVHSQTGRRVRDLRDIYWLEVPCRHINKKPRYVLEGLRDQTLPRRKQFSDKLRARVLLNQICAQCGKTPTEDRVKLDVDHKLPLAWGGDNDIDNLQALCTQCDNGKRDYFTSIDQFADQIRAASSWLELYKRIGEALKAFAAGNESAQSQIVGVVASMHQYQDDWPKRMRELRELGWDYKPRKKKEHGRMRSYYELTSGCRGPQSLLLP